MTILLTEISVKDGFTKHYQKKGVTPEIYEAIVTASQPQEKNILLPLTKWVLKLYEKNPKRTIDELSLLNIENGINILQMFQRLKNLNILTNNSADIGRYSSIRELYTVVKMFDPSDLEGDNAERKKRLMRPEFIEARNDIEKLYEDNEWLVVSPKSYEASVYWGHGTNWCTAYKDSKNYYMQYTESGKLYINIDKRDGNKFQFHFESDSFMDKYDHDIKKPIFENMEATPNLINFYEKTLSPTNFEKLSANGIESYKFVERVNDRFFIAEKNEQTEQEYYDWEDKYNIIDSHTDYTTTEYGFEDYEIDRNVGVVYLFDSYRTSPLENVFDYQNGQVIFEMWMSDVVTSSDNQQIIGIKDEQKLFVYDRRIQDHEAEDYTIVEIIANGHLYLISESSDYYEYCDIFDAKTGDFLFGEWLDVYESSYYKCQLKPLLMLWDQKNGIRKYDLNTSEFINITLDEEYKDVKFLNDYQFAVQFDSAEGDEKWIIYDVDTIQPRFNGAEFDYVICNHETINIPLICYKGKWNIINFFKGKIAFPDLWFDNITPKCQIINGRAYFKAFVGNKNYLITSAGSIHEDDDKRRFSSPKELSRTDPSHITNENKITLSTNDISYIISEAKRLINEISVKDAYAHYQNDMPEELYNWLVQTIQGDNSTLLSDTKWVLKCYRNEGDSMLPKLGDLVEALRVFDRMRVRGMLPSGLSLEQCENVDQLISFTESVNHDEVFKRTPNELSKDIKKAKNDIKVLFDDDNWLVLIPRSMEASMYWGSNTKWCTATRNEENNMYERYTENGPLYININKQTGEKYQFHFGNNEFNDGENKPIKLPVLKNIDNVSTLADFYKKYTEKDKEAHDCLFVLDWELVGEWELLSRWEVRIVYRDGLYNLVNRDFELLSKVWFKYIDGLYPNNASAIVELDGRYFVFSVPKKTFIGNSYDEIWGFQPTDRIFSENPTNYISIVKNNGKYNLINGNGKLLSPTIWFDEIEEDWQQARCVKAIANGEIYIIDYNGKITKQ